MSTEDKSPDLGVCEYIVGRLTIADRDLLSRFPALANDVQILFELGVSHYRRGLPKNADTAILQSVATGSLLSGSLLGVTIPDECTHIWGGRRFDVDMIGSSLRWAYGAGCSSEWPF